MIFRPQTSGRATSMGRHGVKKTPVLALAGVAVAAFLVVLLGMGVMYLASPYLESKSLMERFGNRALTSQASEGDLTLLVHALHNHMDSVVPAVQQQGPGSMMERLGFAALAEIRQQAISRAVNRLSTRDGMDAVIYGWQQLRDRRVTLERGYVSFPDKFSLIMRDATTGDPLTELVLVRVGFGSWALEAIVPHWVDIAGEDLVRGVIGEAFNELAR